MAKNSIFDPTKDGVKADNSGYSSNQIEKMVVNSAAGLIDDETASDDTVYSSAKIYSLLPEDTATGAEVTITDACPDLPIVAGTFNIDANLDGVTEVTISNDTEDVTVTLTDPCYGGYIDYADQKLVTTHKEIDLGSLTWGYNSDRGLFYAPPTSDVKKLNSNALVPDWVCDIFDTHSFNEIRIDGGTYTSGIGQGFIAGVGSNNFVIRDDTFSGNVEAFTEAVTGHYLSYELETSIETAITIPIIKILPGTGTTNIISCDTGDSSITYKKLTTLS